MERIQYNLMVARENLQYAQSVLASCRQFRANVREAEAQLCRAIDRAWEAQCMAQGSL